MGKHIAIIGGGIGGAMTAIALNKVGAECALYEKAEVYGEAGAGLALWPNATRILAEYGLLDKLRPLSSELKVVDTLNAKGKLLNTVHTQKLAEQLHSPILVLLRSHLQKTLLSAIPSAQVHTGKAFVRMDPSASGYTLHFADGSTAETDAIIFADGIHSSARQTHFHFPPLRYAGRMSWRGVAETETPLFPSDRNYEILGKGRRIGIFPLPDNKVYWFAAVNMSEAESALQKNTVECVLSHFPGWGDAVTRLISSTPEDRLILTRIHLAAKPEKLVTGNIALLGDAAHPITPDLGQGACQAIEDAHIMALCLSQHNSITDGFLAYESKRLIRVQMLARNSFRMGRMKQMQNPLAVAVRNTMYRVAPEKFALRLLMRNLTTE